ncbi:MAG: type VI secretion system accessory protein TagJ [Planctomycetota bacterium]|nr:type VI secretion system accessory protein TagJ [Planctomycetota bacterium]
MTPEELLKAGRLDDCLSQTERGVRSAPADPKLRVMLFQVLAVMGQWDRALTQLEVAAEMNAENALMGQMYRAAILCEKFREDVFAGRRSPLILGEPEAWIGMMVQAAALAGQGNHAAASDLRARALEDAPTSAGEIDIGPEEGRTQTQRFEWIADLDETMGPMFEALVDGKYYWVPWNRVQLLRLEPPTDLRDTVWLPGQMVLSAGGEKVVLIPARYPGSELARHDAGLRLGRRTEFGDRGGWEGPLGQRMLNTDAGEYALLTCRAVRIDGPHAPVESVPQAE